MQILQWIFLCVVLTGIPNMSYALRCGTDLIQDGDLMYSVIDKCGDPDAEFAYSTPMLRGAMSPYAGENKIVVWTYNRRSMSGVLHQLRFQDGVLIKVTSTRR
jgi:Protein of unknown function (DUF2845)